MLELSFGSDTSATTGEKNDVSHPRYFRDSFDQPHFTEEGLSVENDQRAVILMGYPVEMEAPHALRRPGAEHGPSQFQKLMKFSHLSSLATSALPSQILSPGPVPNAQSFNIQPDLVSLPRQLQLIDCLAYFGVDLHSFDQKAFPGKLEFASHCLRAGDVLVCIGGGSCILNELSSLTRQPEVVIKIGPSASRAPKGEKMSNGNYLSYAPASFRSKIVHFGVLDYVSSQAEIDAVKEDGASVIFLDKIDGTNVAKFKELVNSLTGKRVTVLIDCEIFLHSYFPGVVSPGIFGLEAGEVFRLFSLLSSPKIRLEGVLFTNYNPAVEARRSGDFLIYLLHHLLTGMARG